MTESLGEFVKKVRNEKGLSVADVRDNAKKHSKQISTSYINKIENEPGVNPSYPKIQALAVGLGVTETEILALIGGTKPNTSKVNKERFDKWSLTFSKSTKSTQERLEALFEMIDREIERAENER